MAGIYQNTESNGNNDYDPTVGDLKTVKFFLEPRDDKWWQTALTIEKSFANNLKFLSATSYFDRKIDYTIDRTDYAAYFNYGFCEGTPTYCWSGLSNGTLTMAPGGGALGPVTPYDQDTTGYNTFDQKNHRFTQEFRLSGDESNYHWVAGLFYEKKDQEWFYNAFVSDFATSLGKFCWSNVCNYDYSANTPNPAGTQAWWFSHDDVNWTQWAVFGDFTYDLTENWIIEVGARYFDQDSDRVYEVDKKFITSPEWPDLAPDQGKRKSSDSDWVPKVSLTYKFDDDKLMYGLYSEGFRAGGVNRNRAPTIFPEEYKPDYLKNYEVGTKTTWADGRLQVNVTGFIMKWSDFQIEILDPSFQDCSLAPPGQLCDGPFQVIVGNVGDAKVKGVEFSIKAAIGEGLDVGLDGTWLNAETTSANTVLNPPDGVPKGSELPMAPQHRYAAYTQYNWPVAFVDGGSMYARVQYSYTDSALNQLEPFPVNAPGRGAQHSAGEDGFLRHHGCERGPHHGRLGAAGLRRQCHRRARRALLEHRRPHHVLGPQPALHEPPAGVRDAIPVQVGRRS